MEFKDYGMIGGWMASLAGLVWKASRQNAKIEENAKDISELKESFKDCVSHFKEEVKTGQTLIMSKLESMHESLGDTRERLSNIEGRMDRNGQK